MRRKPRFAQIDPDPAPIRPIPHMATSTGSTGRRRGQVRRWQQTAEAHRDRLTVVEVARGGSRMRVVVHVMIVGLD